MFVKLPEQQQSDKTRKSRRRAAGSLQIWDTNTPFLPSPVSLSVCSPLLMSPLRDVHWLVGMSLVMLRSIIPIKCIKTKVKSQSVWDFLGFWRFWLHWMNCMEHFFLVAFYDLRHVPIYLNRFAECCKAVLLSCFKNSFVDCKISPDLSDNDWIFIFGWTYPLVCRVRVTVYLPLDLSWSERWNGKQKKGTTKINVFTFHDCQLQIACDTSLAGSVAKGNQKSCFSESKDNMCFTL